MIMTKEENVEDKLTHHQLTGIEKTGITVGLFLWRENLLSKEGITNLHQNLFQNIPQNLHQNLLHNLCHNLYHLKKTWKWQ